MDGKIEIINLFCKDFSRELTIRQISKLIKKSYAYTNKEVWELINSEVLNKKEIGKSLICSLNFNKLSKALLTYNSTIRSKNIETKILTSFKQKQILTAFYSNKKLITITSVKEFYTYLKKSQDYEIVYGFEKYWEMAGDIYE